MSRLQTIENALKEINGTVFQELCDSFLAIRNKNYRAFSRTGSQSGKQKTTIGTPDSFIVLPNGKYLFVEHSTNISEGVSKLKRDIKNCLDTVKTGIPLEEIEEIILCINFNLKAHEDLELRELLKGKRIALTIYSLDALSIEIHLNHRDLASLYLGITLDTGQVISVKQFIEEYNKKAENGITTRLDNDFLHRTTELQDLKDTLHKNDFIILTGPAGVGKTRLAIEGMESFLSENLSYKAYCISNKNVDLLPDLYQYFESDDKYILFVDDANRLDTIDQIVSFFNGAREGKLKVIMTVRNYAFWEVENRCLDFKPAKIDLHKLLDDQIIDIAKAKPLEILNSDYYNPICRIADGNPRLAIMAARLAKEKQDPAALADVLDLFDKYFSTFVKDNGAFADSLTIKCLGLISFFFTIPFKDKETTNSILQNFGITYSEFIDAIDSLDKLEFVEIRYDNVRIPEQNLSTYFFYKAFIEKNELSFQTLLAKYFDDNVRRFRDCVIHANNTFGPEKVMNKMQPKLRIHWSTISNNQEKAFKFLDVFWFYLQDEALTFSYNLISLLPISDSQEYEVTYVHNEIQSDKDELLELIGELFHTVGNLKDALELAFAYIRKKQEHSPKLIYKIRNKLTFDREDGRYGFSRQKILFEVIIDGLEKGDILCSSMFYELAKTFIRYRFKQFKGGRKHAIVFYDYPIPNSPQIQEFRKSIWNTVNNNFPQFPERSLSVLESYEVGGDGKAKEIAEFDLPFVVNIIKTHLSPKSFDHCRLVQKLLGNYKRNSILHKDFPSLKKKFTNPLYERFLKLDWDRRLGKEMYEYTDYQEFLNLKEADIRADFIFDNPLGVRKFYQDFRYLRERLKNKWSFDNSLEIVIDENCSHNFEIGCQLLEVVVEHGNEIPYFPRILFLNQLKAKEKAERIWAIIQSRPFNRQSAWELLFFETLDDSLIENKHVEALIQCVSNIKEPNSLNWDRLNKYLDQEPRLLEIILKSVVAKIESEGLKVLLWREVFSSHFEFLGEDIELIKKAYVQQDEMNDSFDYDGDGLLRILQKDPRFIIFFVKTIYSDKWIGAKGDHNKLRIVWQVTDMDSALTEVFDWASENHPSLGIGDHFCNSFFKNLPTDIQPRASEFLLNYCKVNYGTISKIEIIVDIVRNSMRELFDKILLLHLSKNQDIDAFRQISWRGNMTSASGDVILADIEASDWRNILSIVNRSEIGIKLIPIKQYLNRKIEYCLKCAEEERKRRFLGGD